MSRIIEQSTFPKIRVGGGGLGEDENSPDYQGDPESNPERTVTVTDAGHGGGRPIMNDPEIMIATDCTIGQTRRPAPENPRQIRNIEQEMWWQPHPGKKRKPIVAFPIPKLNEIMRGNEAHLKFRMMLLADVTAEVPPKLLAGPNRRADFERLTAEYVKLLYKEDGGHHNQHSPTVRRCAMESIYLSVNY